MSLHSRLFDALKSADAALGPAAARWLNAPRRPLLPRPTDVLAIRLWGLGNLAILAPHLHAAHGRVRIRLFTLERNGEFVRQHFPWVEPCLLPDPVSPRFAVQLARLLIRLRRDPPEAIVDLEQFLRLPLWLTRTASGAPSIGLDTPGQRRTSLLDCRVPHDPTRHVAETFTALWSAAGLPTGIGLGPLGAPPGALPAALLESVVGDPREGPLIVIHPGSGDHFPGRRWAPERFGQLSSRLARRLGARIVLTGQAAERSITGRVWSALGGAGATDLTARLDTRSLVALLARADLLVTNDTGPLHLADAVGTRAVALYGPNTPHRYGPRAAGSRAVFADLPCSPCLDDRSMKRSRCTDYACMDALSVDAVEHTCLEALGVRSPRVRREAMHAVTP